MKRSGPDPFKVILLLTAIALLLVEGKLVKLQLVEHGFWDLEAQKSRTRSRSIPFERGWILDRNMNPLAYTQSVFELRFVFRQYRLQSPAGQISMVHYLLHGERPGLQEIYEDPMPFLRALRPGDVLDLESRQKRTDLIDYLAWLFDLTREEEKILFTSEALRSIPLARIPALEGRMGTIADRVHGEGAALVELEALLGVEEGKILGWPDRAADRADSLVNRRAGADGTAREPASYLKLRTYHREIDSYENTVYRNITHEAVKQVTLAADRYPGFYVVENTKRSYPAAVQDLGPLLIGKTGLPNERELAALKEHRRRLEEISLMDDKGEEALVAEESLRLKIREIDIHPNEEVGRLGLEAILEPVLRGKRGYLLEERSGRNRAARVLDQTPPLRGQDVVLTLDAEVQAVCEQVLGDLVYGAGMVIMDVRTGAVLAMATSPGPTRLQFSRNWTELAADDRGPLYHRAVYNKNLPPPGSVFKMVTSVAGLEEGICTPHTEFDCPMVIHVGRSTLRCEGLHSAISLEQAIVKSCNVYFYRLGAALGYETLFHWAQRFGFGQRTGYLDRTLYGMEGRFIGFPEGEGPLKLEEVGEANLMRLAIGQGAIDDVTPMQVARMMAGIATGSLPQPHLISRIGDQVFTPPAPVDLGISPQTLDFVRESMRKVVEPGGTAEPDPQLKRDLRPYDVAGKTGTPQVAEGPSHACFAGYWPHASPRWSFAVFVEFCGLHGGEIAAPVLNRVLESPGARVLVGEAGR